MTDEEKAEEYLEKHKEYTKLKGVYHLTVDEKQAYIDGLSEGRKEKCLEQNKDGTIRPCEVMKENEQLKAQIEKMKCCGNCTWQGFCNKSMKISCKKTNLSKWELAEWAN